jgi:hypothetical protein
MCTTNQVLLCIINTTGYRDLSIITNFIYSINRKSLQWFSHPFDLYLTINISRMSWGYTYPPSSQPLQWKFMCNEEYCILWCDTVYHSGSSPTFRRNALPPSSGSKSKPSKESARSKQPEAVQSSMTSVSFYWTTQHHIPEDSTPHSLRCENLKSNSSAAFVGNIYNRPTMSNVGGEEEDFIYKSKSTVQSW